MFQKDYSKQIDAAIEQLKQPITLSDPHSCWLQLRQVTQSIRTSSFYFLQLALFNATSYWKTIWC
jgi:hypothetical protein